MRVELAVRDRRDEVAGAFFPLWVVSGLFLDGWAHQADKAESFWTPWHAVLYSGLFVGGIYAAVRGWQARRRGEPALSDPLIGVGLLAFLLGGLGDAAWHTAFGVEENLEALLSPTHLLLMAGGILLTSGPVRTAWARPDRAPSLRALLPALVGATLTVATIGFFLQFASPFRPEAHTFTGAPSDTEMGLAVLGMVVTTCLLVGAMLVLRARWALPRHALLILSTGFAGFMTALHGFSEVALVLPAVLAGAVADVLVGGGARARTIGLVVPTVLWLSWFAIYAALWPFDWTPEIWTGSVLFAVLTGYGLSYLAEPPASVPAVRESPVERQLSSRPPEDSSSVRASRSASGAMSD